MGPLLIVRNFDVKIVENNNTWANSYNLLFIDQPVGTGLSYADESYSKSYVTSMDGKLYY
jgi:carboxypeptidase C (cathepsin A)